MALARSMYRTFAPLSPADVPLDPRPPQHRLKENLKNRPATGNPQSPLRNRWWKRDWGDGGRLAKGSPMQGWWNQLAITAWGNRWRDGTGGQQKLVCAVRYAATKFRFRRRRGSHLCEGPKLTNPIAHTASRTFLQQLLASWCASVSGFSQLPPPSSLRTCTPPDT